METLIWIWCYSPLLLGAGITFTIVLLVRKQRELDRVTGQRDKLAEHETLVADAAMKLRWSTDRNEKLVKQLTGELSAAKRSLASQKGINTRLKKELRSLKGEKGKVRRRKGKADEGSH